MRYYCFFLFLCCTSVLQAQDGTLDASFGTGGWTTTDFFDRTDTASRVTQQNDGKLVVIGSVEFPSGEFEKTIVRYGVDGQLDTSFGDNGSVFIYPDSGYHRNNQIHTLNDDSIISAGTINGSDSEDFLVSKLLQNGNIDTSYGDNGHVIIDIPDYNDRLFQMEILENEKSLLLGRSSLNSDYYISLVQLLPNGDLDPSFGTNGILLLDYNEGFFSDLSFGIQDDGGIVIVVGHENFGSSTISKVFKLTSVGDLDLSFGENGFVEINSDWDHSEPFLRIDPEGKILVFNAEFEVGAGKITGESSIRRFHANGEIDNSFGVEGIHYFNAVLRVHNIIVQGNQRIIIAGGIDGFEGSYYFFLRLYHNGSPDNSLQVPFFPKFESSYTILQDDGKIIGLGETYWFNGDRNFIIVRYDNDPLSIEENPFQKVALYPNPSRDIFTLQLASPIAKNFPYRIVDVSGKIVQEGLCTSSSTSIDLGAAQRGMYFLHIENSTFKLLKE